MSTDAADLTIAMQVRGWTPNKNSNSCEIRTPYEGSLDGNQNKLHAEDR